MTLFIDFQIFYINLYFVVDLFCIILFSIQKHVTDSFKLHPQVITSTVQICVDAHNAMAAMLQ